jgi:hypothetical protein
MLTSGNEEGSWRQLLCAGRANSRSKDQWSAGTRRVASQRQKFDCICYFVLSIAHMTCFRADCRVARQPVQSPCTHVRSHAAFVQPYPLQNNFKVYKIR